MSDEPANGRGQATRTRRRATRTAGPTVTAEPPVIVVPAAAIAESDVPRTDADTPQAADDRGVLWRWIVPVVVVSVVVALAVACGVLGYLHYAAEDREALRQQYIQTARQTVLNLTTIHPATARRDVDRVLADASGEFKAELDSKRDQFVQVVQKVKLGTDGQIIEAGLEAERGDEATVLVAAHSMVTNEGADKPESRDFRFRATLREDGGHVTVSKLEFVP